jgi:hypothetical protein
VELVNSAGFAIVRLKTARVERMLRFKLGTVHLEFFGKLSLRLIVLRALEPS